MLINKASSITHEHLLSIINTELCRFTDGHVIRILDVGCGNGNMISYLVENLPLLNPSKKFEVFGFDVNNHGVQQSGFFRDTIEKLASKFLDILWQDRLACISVTDKWPYENKFFNIIISNQVGEHINNHDLFFSKIERTLMKDGFSTHLFPLKHYLLEGHLLLPLVHKIMNYDILKDYICRTYAKLHFSHHIWRSKSFSDTICGARLLILRKS